MENQVSYSLNSFKGGYMEAFPGDYYRCYEGGYEEIRLQLKLEST